MAESIILIQLINLRKLALFFDVTKKQLGYEEDISVLLKVNAIHLMVLYHSLNIYNFVPK